MSHTYCFFGRCNPPTVAHQNIVQEYSLKGDLQVYLSKKEMEPRNPLPYGWKVALCEEAFGVPIRETTARNPLEALTELYEEGYNEVTMILGEDRMDMRNRIMMYNGSLYHFDNIYFENSGDRTDNISSTRLRSELKEQTKSDILPIELWKYSEQISEWVSESSTLGATYHMVKTLVNGREVWKKQRRPLLAKKKVTGDDSLSTIDNINTLM